MKAALEHAERLAAAGADVAIVVQHSDRLARGDGAKAQHLVEHVLWARKHDVNIRSVQDPQTFDSMGLVYAALMGDRNHEDSARKSMATRDGLKRRSERGEPVGALPDGYEAKDVIEDGRVRSGSPCDTCSRSRRPGWSMLSRFCDTTG